VNVVCDVLALDDIGEGHPLVLLHGVGASREVWTRVRRPLAADRRVITPDLPGFGDSPPAGPGFDLEAVDRALANGLAARIDEPLDLLGNSLGGAVAIVLADLRPRLVRSLVLSAPAGFSTQPWPVALAAGHLIGPLLMARRIVGTPVAASPIARRLLLGGAIARPQKLPTRYAVTMLSASEGSRRLGPAVSAVLQEDLTERLAELEVPLGIIWGREDRVVPIATLERICAVAPQAVIERMENAAHVPQLERPRAFVSALRRILGQFA
jgi:pimeloyl-ACP methyl ester carboxylesterase